MTEVWIRIPKQDYLVADAEDYANEVEMADGEDVDVDYAFDIQVSDILTGELEYEIEVVE